MCAKLPVFCDEMRSLATKNAAESGVATASHDDNSSHAARRVRGWSQTQKEARAEARAL
jgi:hypothetical protein